MSTTPPYHYILTPQTCVDLYNTYSATMLPSQRLHQQCHWQRFSRQTQGANEQALQAFAQGAKMDGFLARAKEGMWAGAALGSFSFKLVDLAIGTGCRSHDALAAPTPRAIAAHLKDCARHFTDTGLLGAINGITLAASCALAAAFGATFSTVWAAASFPFITDPGPFGAYLLSQAKGGALDAAVFACVGAYTLNNLYAEMFIVSATRQGSAFARAALSGACAVVGALAYGAYGAFEAVKVSRLNAQQPAPEHMVQQPS